MAIKLEKYAVDVLNSEAAAIKSLALKLMLADTRNAFRRIINLILNCNGRVVVSGMGKAGIIGQKISATLASTGTPSLFLHPAEAYHGDLGRVTKDDVVLTLSNSGETEEIVRLLPSLKKIGARIISITRSKKSMLGKYSDVVIETGYIKESCPIGVVPSASTTALLALGDAIALTVFNSRPLKDKSFAREQFAFYHPGGELGRQFLKVKEIMRTGKRNPIINSKKTVKEALILITRSRSGAINIIDAKGKLAGIFTDGDLRRHISR
ncbi:MAG: KpsF/GutQ family sugar-phosphate isomerase, partial [Planctomycetes bacterium]|nr:KpsF/GutQ family sugar-phosphate isomerase [Planctomycetota bacterium]